MTYVIHCDWCGKRLKSDDYAKFEIHVERQSVPGELDRKWAREVKPTRFFCVTSTRRDEANRMGLPLDVFEPAADCYERAIAAITGVATDRPDAGMEWRLVEVDYRERVKEERQHERDERRERSTAKRLEARAATIQRQREQNRDNAGRDEIGLLMLDPITHSALCCNAVHTITELEGSTDDELLALHRIGLGRVREIREAIKMVRGTVASPQPAKDVR